MSDLIDRKYAIETIEINKRINKHNNQMLLADEDAIIDWLKKLPSAEPEIIRCCQCAFWDRDTLRYQFNEFRNWNEAECKVLAERDGYNEISHYVEADDFCSRAEQRMEVEHDE